MFMVAGADEDFIYIVHLQEWWRGGSSFCTGDPINTLAEPKDVVIVCGEFNSGVQIQSLSEEHEQVFTVKKISQYPHYNPKRVNIMITNILALLLLL